MRRIHFSPTIDSDSPYAAYVQTGCNPLSRQIVAFLAVFLLVGCSDPSPGRLPRGSFDGGRLGGQTRGDGIEASIRLVRSELGFDPGEFHFTPLETISTASVLGTLDLKGDDRVEEHGLIAFASRIQPAARRPGLVVGHDESISVFLGVVEDDGVRYLQFLKGEGAPYLVPEADLQDDNSALLLPIQSYGVEFVVGETILHFDRLFHNAGLIIPFEKVETVFRMTNRGSNPVQIPAPPSSSCGCTVGKIAYDEPILPGETREMQVAVHSRDKPFRYHISLLLEDTATGVNRTVNLEVAGVVFQSMEVTPTVVDFGRVNRNEEIVRRVYLREVPEDRFEVVHTKVGGLPIETSVASEKSSGGLAAYRIDLKIPSGSLIATKQTGTLAVRTTSRLRPLVEVPVYVAPNPEIEAVPKTVFFGALKAGEVKSRFVSFNVPNGEPFELELLRVPESLQAAVVQDGGHARLKISPDMQSPTGLLSDEIKVRVRTAKEERDLTIKCVAYVKS